jgi:RluA family pseudouridine synthase
MARPLRFRVVPQEEGMMLGHLVARRMHGTPLDAAKALVRAGAVYMGHLRVRVPTARVAAGERITVYPEAAEAEELDIAELRFVHREDLFVVLDKPAGVPVASTRESSRGTLAEALRRRLEADGVVRPYVGVVHRLDRGAAGLVLFTTRSVANASLHHLFANHAIDRRYRVLVHGEPAASLGEQFDCDLPLLELHSGNSKAAPGNPHARAAVTHFRRLRARTPIAGTTLLEAVLETGRHHQIRVHAAALGHPVVGDRRYGGAHANDDDGERDDADGSDRHHAALHLLARELQFEHPLASSADVPARARIHLFAQTPAWACSADDPPARDLLP